MPHAVKTIFLLTKRKYFKKCKVDIFGQKRTKWPKLKKQKAGCSHKDAQKWHFPRTDFKKNQICWVMIFRHEHIKIYRKLDTKIMYVL